MSDLISRADVLKYPIRLDHYDEVNGSREFVYGVESVIEYVESLPSAEAESDDLIIKGAKGIKDGLYNITDGKLFKYKANGGTVRTYPIVPSADAEWIPCGERLPSDDEIVNITWVNHNPPPYYADIEGKPFVASGLRYRDKWYWYSSVCQDLHQDFDIIDKDIEVIAWQPLPKPYKGGDDE